MFEEEVYSELERKIDVLREKKTKTDRKTVDEVFDKSTLMAIYKLMKEGVLDTVEFPISTGKEGNVFLSTTPEGEFTAIKIYRMATSTFKRISRYIEGDPRFRGISSNRRKVIFAWASKEFRNLQRLENAGLRVPSPITSHKNLLVMEYIGHPEMPAPMMKEVQLEDPEEWYADLVNFIEIAYQEAGLVHGDLSEYNVLIDGGEAVVIDCGQAVVKSHSGALDLLKRDIGNVNRYFGNLGVDVRDEEEFYEQVIGG